MGHDRDERRGSSSDCCVHVARRSRAHHLCTARIAARTANLRGKIMRKEYDFSKARRGPVLKTPPGKSRITIRIDDDIIDWFKTRVEEAGGGNYQTLMNQALRRFIDQAEEPLESTLRRVLREELRRAS
ncbi:MAG TPA: BrnA antitoxin family protein [Bryobacteraceae bacterium]|nr:BrnA antitoxin family protein [Bryobacteraceae bacterium]